MRNFEAENTCKRTFAGLGANGGPSGIFGNYFSQLYPSHWGSGRSMVTKDKYKLCVYADFLNMVELPGEKEFLL